MRAKEEEKKSYPFLEEFRSINMYVNTNCNDQDCDYAEVYYGMNQDSYPTCAHVTELYHPCPRWQLEQQPWWQKDEQNYCNNDRSPICTHFSLFFSFSNSLRKWRFWMFENFSSGTNWEKKRCTFYYVVGGNGTNISWWLRRGIGWC